MLRLKKIIWHCNLFKEYQRFNRILRKPLSLIRTICGNGTFHICKVDSKYLFSEQYLLILCFLIAFLYWVAGSEWVWRDCSFQTLTIDYLKANICLLECFCFKLLWIWVNKTVNLCFGHVFQWTVQFKSIIFLSPLPKIPCLSTIVFSILDFNNENTAKVL